MGELERTTIARSVTSAAKRTKLDLALLDKAIGAGSFSQEIVSKLCWIGEHDKSRCGAAREILPRAVAFVASNEYRQLLHDVRDAQGPAERSEVAENLGKLVASFPNTPKADLRVFGACLADDVESKTPSHYAIATACRKLRQTCRFLPTIFEVLQAVAEAEQDIETKRRTLTKLPDYIRSTENTIADYERYYGPLVSPRPLQRMTA